MFIVNVPVPLSKVTVSSSGPSCNPGSYPESSVTVPYSFAPIHLTKQSAASVGWLGLKLLAEGKTVTAEEFVPTYLRISQAEREREERLEGK